MEAEAEVEITPPRRRSAPPAREVSERSDIDTLRAELAELKSALLGAAKAPKQSRARTAAKAPAKKK